MSVVLQMKAVLARNLIDNIAKADYLEGLADEIRRMAEGVDEGGNAIIEGIIKLYGRAEEFRTEVIDIISHIPKSEGGEAEEDSAP